MKVPIPYRRLLTIFNSLALILGSLPWQPAIYAQTAPAEDTTPPEVAPLEEAPVKTSGEVLQLEKFQVTTSLGRYHETTSGMAGKVPLELKEVAGSLQIFNANALMDRNAVTLQDVYTYIIGMNQLQPNVNGFTFRGFSSAGSFSQNINYDGLMGSTSQKGALNAENVDRVEFLKGPNSVLYGQMKPGGMLNIVTKIPQERQSTSIRASVTTYGGYTSDFGNNVGYTASVDTTGPIDKDKHWLYRLVVAGTDLSPFRDNDYLHAYYIYPSLTYKWTKDTYITFKVEAIEERRHQDDFLQPVSSNPNLVAEYNVSYQEPNALGTDSGDALSMFFATKFGDNWVLRLNNRNVWHQDEIRELNTRGQTITARTPVTDSTVNRRYTRTINDHNYSFADLNLYGKVGPDSFQNTPLFGIYGGHEYFENHRLANNPLVPPPLNIFHPIVTPIVYPADGQGVLDGQQPLSTFSLYFSDQIRIHDRWHVSIGTRYEQQISSLVDPTAPNIPKTDQFVSEMTSQAGVVFDINKVVSVYAGWSQSFLPADVSAVDANGNAGFPSETGVQYEGGVKMETPNHNFYASLAAYEIVRTNVAVGTGLQIPLPDGRAIFRLDGEQQSKGIEFETQWLPIPNWQFQGGIAYNKAVITESTISPISVGRTLANAPRYSANFWTRYNVPDGRLRGFGVGLGVIYVSEQFVGNPATTTPAYYPIPGWTRVDTAFFYKWRHYTFALDIKNVLDDKYLAVGFNATTLIPGEPRKFTFSMTRQF